MLNFTSEENLLILELLELSPSYMSYLQGQQQNAYNALGEAFLNRVREILDEYTVLEENAAESGSEVKTGMKKLDVIEWFSPSESGNSIAESRNNRLKNKLCVLLNISKSMVSTGYQGTPIYIK